VIKVEQLEKIVKVALYTGRILNERPLSILVVAAVGAGKTDLLSKFSEKFVDSVLYASDITAFALHHKHGKQLKKGMIRHIIIPDLLTPLNKARDQADHFITFMNGIIEEGIARVESQKSNFVVDIPIRCGLITSLATRELKIRKDKWASVGFLSRMLPISFEYKQETVMEIFEYITDRAYLTANPKALNLPPDTDVILPKDISESCIPLAQLLKDRDDKYGFRRLKQIQTFIMGHALMNGRTIVEEEDLQGFVDIVDFVSYKCKAKI